MRTLSFIFIVLTLLMQYTLWFGAGSTVPDLLHMKKTVALEAEKNKLFQGRNHVLEAEVRNLKSGQTALEERARKDFGMIKNNEIYYELPD